MREFEVAAGRAAVQHTDDISFMLDTDELIAHAPTSGQLALFLRGGREGGMQSLQSLLDLMESVLRPGDYKLIQRLLRQGMDMKIVSDMATFFVEQWSGRPTQPPSDSSPTPSATGQESTETSSAVQELEPATT